MANLKSVLLTVAFWAQALERAVKTFAQTAVASIGAEAFDVVALDWADVASISAGAAVVSLLTSVASIPIGADKTSPSVV